MIARHAWNACRRPDRGSLAQLVQEAAALPCTMPEQATMLRILNSYDRWQVRHRLCAVSVEHPIFMMLLWILRDSCWNHPHVMPVHDLLSWQLFEIVNDQVQVGQSVRREGFHFGDANQK